MPPLSILKLKSPFPFPSELFQVPTSSALECPSGFCFDLQLIENNNINNNTIKDTILGIELNWIELNWIE